MDTSQQILRTLQSIDATLKALLTSSVARGGNDGSDGGDGPIASDRDLDGQYGDPEIKIKDPRDWTGDNMRGRRFSECPPEYLDLVADRLDWFAEKAEESGETYNGKPVAPYKRKDAARARGWARRLRNGWRPADTSGAFDPDDKTQFGNPWGADNLEAPDDDIPF